MTKTFAPYSIGVGKILSNSKIMGQLQDVFYGKKETKTSLEE